MSITVNFNLGRESREEKKKPTEQNMNNIIVANPPTPLETVLQNMPRAAVTAAFFVSSATCPDASKPIRTPAVARYERHQFHPAPNPVPLYVGMNASCADRNPQVLFAPIGNQMTFMKKSSMTKNEDR